MKNVAIIPTKKNNISIYNGISDVANKEGLFYL